jgi:putative ABC transport system permease protein
MGALKQIGAVTSMNLRSLPRRIGTSSVIVVGIAGVVGVLISVLAMSSGMIKMTRATARDDRAIVTRVGAAAELGSSLDRRSVDAILDTPGIKRDAGGKPVASAETFSLALLERRDGTDARVPLRGVGPNAFALRPEIKLIEGRMFEPAVTELIVGKGAQLQYQGLEVGSELRIRSSSWKIVGVFTSNGDLHEGELMASNDVLQSALYRVGSFNSVTAMLDSPAAFSAFKDAITSNPALAVDVSSERDYAARQSQGVSNLLAVIAYVIGGIMAIGAVFGALNTMYSAVSSRSVEIATLRAIGFGAAPIVIAVIMEALLLALIGGAIGALLAWLLFNGYTVTSSAGSVESRVFSLDVSASLMVTGVVAACIIGLIGGLFPSIRAAKMQVATLLRGA